MTELQHFFAIHADCIEVAIKEARGSTPRETGAAMWVSATDTIGSIGGGRLEWLAIREARTVLGDGRDLARMELPLGPEIGQCCGGRVTLELTRMSTAARTDTLQRLATQSNARPAIYVLGAGHVGRALASVLAGLPVRTILVDQRQRELDRCTASVERRLTAIPEAVIASAARRSAFVVLTHDHALDFLLTAAALAKGDAAYVGMIGSKTKRAKFIAWHREVYGDPPADHLTCPIGVNNLDDKRPEVIALSVAAEVVPILLAQSGNAAACIDDRVKLSNSAR